MFKLLPNTNIDFLGKRVIAFGISSVLMVLGIVGLIRLANGSAPMAIDFTGGSSLTIKLQNHASLEKLRETLSNDFKEVSIQPVNSGADKAGEGFDYLIRLPKAQGNVETGKDEVLTVTDKALDLLVAALDGNKLLGSSAEEIGPSVSKSLRVKSLKAVTVALFFILLYIMVRFDFRFSVGAVVATVHDILAVVGIMVVSGVDFSLMIVVALLTVAGYSLNDTVVVYDRIRENRNNNRSRPFVETINISLNQVLSRTINTSLTTILVLTALHVLGGQVFAGFSLALIIGVLVGTYSSLFVASPLVYEWNLRRPPR